MERIPCAMQEVCPLAETRRGCFEDVHHEYYPAADYKTSVQKEFRELDDNKVRVCRDVHNEAHHVLEVPEMPSRDYMLIAIHAEKARRKSLREIAS